MEDNVSILNDDEIETSLSEESIKIYFKEIRKFPSLTKNELNDLLKQYKNGNISAREKIINSSLRLVVYVAGSFIGRLNSMTFIDIIQEGNIGLMRALETYNPEIGAFSTYAVIWIKQYINRALEEKNAEIREPTNFQSLKHKFIKLYDKYKQKYNKIPTDEWLCEKLNISLERLKQINESLSRKILSANKSLKEDEDDELIDFIPDNKNEYDQFHQTLEDRELFLVLKEVLSPIEFYIVYYTILTEVPKTIVEISKKFRLNQATVNQFKNKALNNLKLYAQKDSIEYQEILKKIINKYGKYLDKVSVEPIEPINMIKYLYIKERLTKEESTIYYLTKVEESNFSLNDYCNILKCTKEELLQILNNLKEKTYRIFEDKNDFERFKNNMFMNYKSKIIDSPEIKETIDYQRILDTYSSISFDEFSRYFENEIEELDEKEKKLLSRYFGNNDISEISSVEVIEKNINLLLFGYKNRDIDISNASLYKVFNENIFEFTEEQQLYLECFFFKNISSTVFYEKYPNSNLRSYLNKLISKLEKMYFNIYKFNENNFSKEKYKKVRKKYKDKLGTKKCELLDLYYGIEDTPKTIMEIAKIYDEDYIKIHDLIRDAKTYAMNIYYNRNISLNLDKKIYIPYIKNKMYEYTEETRELLKLFLIENKTYEEIELITGLSKTRISNIITDGIRRIDYYRFGIIKPSHITLNELKSFFEYDKNFTKKEQQIISAKFYKHMNNESISKDYKISNEDIIKLISIFNKKYLNYQIKNVIINAEDIAKEINATISENVLDEEDKEFLSYYFGIKNSYNEDGIKISFSEIGKITNNTKNLVHGRIIRAIDNIKKKKIGIYDSLIYIDKNEMEDYLKDKRLPITDKEKYIIKHLLELDGFEYKSLEELSLIINETPKSLKRRYQRSIVTIYKYINEEIEGIISKEDILNNLRYFSYEDKQYLIDFYIENLTYEKMAKKYKMSYYQICHIMNRLKNDIYEIVNNLTPKKFDFDFYTNIKNVQEIPYYGDVNLAINAFNLFYGVYGTSYTLPEIIEKLKLNMTTYELSNIISSLMLSVCKYQKGILKNNFCTHNEICNYFLNRQDSMNKETLKRYKKYFRLFEEEIPIPNYLNESIANDILKDKEEYFKINKATKDDVLILLKKHKLQLNKKTYESLLRINNINERQYMNGSEISRDLKIINKLEKQKVKEDEKLLLLNQN